MSDVIAIAGLIVSAVAAWFAFKAWQHPKRPLARTLQRFEGSALDDGEKLADFLLSHEGNIVQLSVEVGLVPTASVDGAMALEGDVLTLEYQVGEELHSVTYHLIKSEEAPELLKRRTVSLVLEGAFVPTLVSVRDAARMEGTLTQVGPVDLAQYVS